MMFRAWVLSSWSTFTVIPPEAMTWPDDIGKAVPTRSKPRGGRAPIVTTNGLTQSRSEIRAIHESPLRRKARPALSHRGAETRPLPKQAMLPARGTALPSE